MEETTMQSFNSGCLSVHKYMQYLLMLVSKQLSIICFFQSHTNGGLLIGELADTTVINNMQRSDVHKVADCRHTQQSPAQLIRVSLPRSPVKMPNCQSQHKKLQVWKLLGNGLKKAFSFL